jgi:hypothetical protein
VNFESLKKVLSAKWIKHIIQLVVVLTSFIYIYNQTQEINFSEIKINYFGIAISVLITTFGTWLGAVSWWIALRVFRQKLSFSDVMIIQFKSNLVKYIPGIGWQLVSKTHMTAKKGIPLNLVITGMLFEFGEIILSGLILAVILIPTDFNLTTPIYTFIVQNSRVLRIGTLILVVIFPFVFQLILKTLRIVKDFQKLDTGWVLPLFALLSFTWVINSIGFSFAYNALETQIRLSFPLSAFIVTLTFVFGLLVVIVPGSFGVRESLFILFLTPLTGGGIAGVIAIIYRIITISSEILVVFADFVRRKIIKRVSINEK